MEITVKTFLIAVPLLFLGGLVDSIAGGGGLITLPAYMLAGLPVHNAIATNKLSSSMGTAVSATVAVKNNGLKWMIAIPAVFTALIGGTVGARISMLIDERTLEIIMLILLPLIAIAVMSNKIFKEVPEEEEVISLKTVMIILPITFAVGMYDGFYGPGTGVFLLMGYMLLAKLCLKTSYTLTKLVNFCTGFASFITYVRGGYIVFALGFVCGLSNMLGNFIGSRLALKNGSRIVRPIIVLVIVLFMAKIIFDF